MEKNNTLQALSLDELTAINGGSLYERVKGLLGEHKSVGYIIMYILEYCSQSYQDEVMEDIESGDIWSGYC